MIHVAPDPQPVVTQPLGRLGGEPSTVIAATGFVAVGLRWAEPLGARILVRAREPHGRWSEWINASCVGHSTDYASERSTAQAFAFCGDPIWTGPAHQLQLRADRPVRDVTLFLVSDAATAGNGEGEMAAALPLAQPILDAGPGQPPIIARDAWSQGKGPVAPPQYGRVRMAFIHHSDGVNGYSAAQVPQILRAIYRFHVDVRGWNDIGYNFAIDRFGRIWEARYGGIDQAVVGAQAGGYNVESFGAVLLGDYMAAEPSAAAVRAFEQLIAWKLPLHGVPVSGKVTVEVDPADAFYTPFKPGQRVSLHHISGHRDGCTTSCPGNDLYARIPAVRTRVEQLAGEQTRLTLTLGGDVPATGVTLAAGDKLTPAEDLSLATVTISYGQQLPVAGALTSSGGIPVTAATVTLQQLTLDGDRPVTATIASATTDADGRWSAALTPTESIMLRALHTAAPATTAPLTLVLVAPVVTATITPATEQRRVTLSGSVTPALPRATVEIRAAAGKQKLVKTKRLKLASGAFSESFTLAAGSYQLRVTTAEQLDFVAGSSGWQDFTIA